MGFVSPNFPALFGRAPLVWRWFDAEEDGRGEPLLVIGQRFAERRFGSVAAALGRDLTFANANWRIIGVMPPDYRVPWLDVQIWAALRSHPEWIDKSEQNAQQTSRRWDLIARLRPGVSLTAAQAERWTGYTAGSARSRHAIAPIAHCLCRSANRSQEKPGGLWVCWRAQWVFSCSSR